MVGDTRFFGRFEAARAVRLADDEDARLDDIECAGQQGWQSRGAVAIRMGACRGGGRGRRGRVGPYEKVGRRVEQDTLIEMKQRKLYYKTDFKIWERCECGFGAPFYFIYFTNNPRCGVVASYDGREYHGCRLMEDGRLCVAFDDHGLGLGVLRVERRFYLNDADYASGVCDEVFPPTPVTCDDGDEQYNLCLSLDGALSELNASSVVPPYFIKGEDAKINGVNSIEIVGEAVKQEGDRLTIDAYSKGTVDRLLGDKATKQELQNTAQGLGQSISSVDVLARSAKETAENLDTEIAQVSDMALQAGTMASQAGTMAYEAKQIALGANRSVTFATYKEMIHTLEGGSGVFESLYGAKAKVGQNIYIAALNVPDCWIAEVDEQGRLTPSEYDKESPTFDNDIANLLVSENGLIINTWIRLRALETQKVDLTEYDREINGLKDNMKNLQDSKANNTDVTVLQDKINDVIHEDNTVKLSKVTPSGDLQHYMYELIGAIYNDTGSDIVRNAPWADLVDDDNESDKYVTHKAGYWYMNGLGDLTNDDMRNILVYGQVSDIPKLFKGCVGLKTSYNKKMYNLDISRAQIFQSSSFLVLGDYDIYLFDSGLRALFYSCASLKAIFANIDFSSVSSAFSNTFNNCKSLRYVKLLHLKINIDLHWSPLLSVKSILYMISNAQTTNNFTITLHDDVYARALQNGDVISALYDKPNITLASASGQSFIGTTTTTPPPPSTDEGETETMTSSGMSSPTTPTTTL